MCANVEMSQQASWQADVFDDEIMEQDEECEDYDEIEPPPAKRKSKKTTSERCKTKQEGERKTTRRRLVSRSQTLFLRTALIDWKL